MLLTTSVLVGAVVATMALPDPIAYLQSTNVREYVPGWPAFNGQNPLDGSHLHHPWPPHHDPGPGNETIYNTLSNDKEYSKLTKAINFVDGIADILNDSSSHVTFFATPDSALRPPHKRHGSTVADTVGLSSLVQAYDLSDAINRLDELESSSIYDDKDKEKKRKILKIILHAILSYHILPTQLDAVALVDNSTYATKLVLPKSLGGQSLRIKVARGLIPPVSTINVFSIIVRPDRAATNGVIHGINHPLLPPPPIFQELFMAPSVFSTLTSAIQRVGLTDALDLRYVRGKDGEKGSLEGVTAVTVFAPTNRAFRALPKKLQLFLFSPFGSRILKKLLQFHVVPGAIFYTDYQYNKSESSTAGHSGDFDISEIGSLGTDEYPLQYTDFDSGLENDMYSEYCHEYDVINDHYPEGPFPDYQPPRESEVPPPSNPFQFSTKHYDEIIGMDTEKYEALTDAQQEYVANYLELFDILTNGRPVDTSYPIPLNHFEDFPMHNHGPPPMAGPIPMPPHMAIPMPPPWTHPGPPQAERPRHDPISSFDQTLPTALTNHSIHAHVEKYNATIPFPGPHKPHRIWTKFTVDGHPVLFPDLVGLNGAVHVIDRLLDPRGKHPRHPHRVDEFGEENSPWEDWEDWLPKWAAEN